MPVRKPSDILIYTQQEGFSSSLAERTLPLFKGKVRRKLRAVLKVDRVHWRAEDFIVVILALILITLVKSFFQKDSQAWFEGLR